VILLSSTLTFRRCAGGFTDIVLFTCCRLSVCSVSITDARCLIVRQNCVRSECSVGSILRGAGAAVHVPSSSAADTAVCDRTASCTVCWAESRCRHSTAVYVAFSTLSLLLPPSVRQHSGYVITSVRLSFCAVTPQPCMLPLRPGDCPLAGPVALNDLRWSWRANSLREV